MPLFEHEYSVVTKDGQGKRTRLSNQASLARLGPVLQVAISVTPEHASIMAERGTEVPSPISGLALIDTGASITAVDENVCRHLSLAPTDSILMSHAGGQETRECFPVQIMFPGTPLPPVANPRVVSCKLDAPQILLLGRDLLSMMKFVYNGPQGRIEIAF